MITEFLNLHNLVHTDFAAKGVKFYPCAKTLDLEIVVEIGT